MKWRITRRAAFAKARKPLSPRAARVLRIVFAVLAIGLQGLGGYLLYERERWVASSAVAEGTVVGLKSQSGRKGRTSHREIVRFTAANGLEFEFTEPVGTSHPYGKGERVPVRYQPAHPGDASIDSTLRIYLVPGLLLSVGVGFALFAMFVKASKDGGVGVDPIAPDAHGRIAEGPTDGSGDPAGRSTPASRA